MYNCLDCNEQIKSPILTGNWDCPKCHDETVSRLRNTYGTYKKRKIEKDEPKPIRLTKKQSIVKSFKSGLKDTHGLCELYDVAPTYVYKALKEAGLHRNRRRLQDNIDLFAEGYSIYEVAEIANVELATARIYLSKYRKQEESQCKNSIK